MDNNHLDKQSPIPVYYQLKNIILEKIRDGYYQAGNLIPSERDLSNTFGITRMTVRQAVNQLVSEGILYREKGKGTYVSKTKLEQKNIMSFSETVKGMGLIPSTRVLHFQKKKPQDFIRELLEIDTDEDIYEVERLRLADNEPVAIETDFFPSGLFPDFKRHDFTSSLYDIIHNGYGFTVYSINSVIESSMPSPEEKKLLGISDDNLPVLRVTGVNYSQTDVILFYEECVYRSDKYKYNLNIRLNK